MFGWIKEWVTGTLEYLVPFFFKKRAKVIFLGLEGAGKSTLFHRLKTGEMTQTQPSLHPNSDVLDIGNVRYTVFDTGGIMQARRIWTNHYVTSIDAILFIVDGGSRDRFQEAKEELEGILKEDLLSDAPVAVLINKIDLPACVGEAQFLHDFDLIDKVTGRNGVQRGSEDKYKRPLEIFPVSILQKYGYDEAFKWVAQHVK